MNEKSDKKSDESDECDEKEGLKTLADYVRETGEHFDWPEETIHCKVSQAETQACYQTYSPAAFQHIWSQICEDTVYAGQQRRFTATIRQPTLEGGDNWLSPQEFKPFGEPEYTIWEVKRDDGRQLRSPQNASQQPAARAGCGQAGNRANPSLRESVETWKL